MWNEITHVKSSLPPKENGYAMFMGRWQPLHKGHQELFDRVLKRGENICIAIRDIEPDQNNPFTAEQVRQNIEQHYADLIAEGKVKVIVMPCDITSIQFGRGVGYDIIEHVPPQEIADISATKIREKLREDGQL